MKPCPVSYGGQNHSTPVFVAEWDARACFNGPIDRDIDTSSTPGYATLRAPAHAGFRSDLRTSTDLDFSAPPIESHVGDSHWHDFSTWPMDEPRRFWRLERVEEATDEL